MVEQYTENQYDDDLTVEAGNYEEYDPVGAVDLFEFSYQEESPISRLKSLILSIDWEITDEILIQFNDELVDLKDVWAAEKINLVYIQALEKISKYIYQQKADAHPDAIKLLLTFYYNLEKIVYSEDLTEYKKKDILLKDVKRFEFLKRQITDQGQDNHMFRDEEGRQKKLVDEPTGGDELLALKAIVLGIDWEITDQDLNGLREEVIRLEDEYADKVKGLQFYISVDLAISEKDYADYTAITVVGVNRNNNWFVLHMDYGRYQPDATVQKIMKLARMYKDSTLVIEKGTLYLGIKKVLQNEMLARNTFFQIKEVTRGTSKLVVVKTLEPRLNLGKLWLPKHSYKRQVEELKHQMSMVTNSEIKAKHDDLLDTLGQLGMIDLIGSDVIDKDEGKVTEWVNPYTVDMPV